MCEEYRVYMETWVNWYLDIQKEATALKNAAMPKKEKQVKPKAKEAEESDEGDSDADDKSVVSQPAKKKAKV